MSGSSDQVPFLREALRAQYPAAPLQAKGPAIISVFIFLFFMLIGFALNAQAVHNTHLIFLACFLAGSLLSSASYILTKRIFRADTEYTLKRLVMSNYDALLGRMHGWGFTAAAQACQHMLEKTFALHKNAPQLFQTLDEFLHTFLIHFSQIGQAKILIGNEHDLKRHSDRLADAFGRSTENIAPKNLTAARIELAALELRIEKLEDIAKCALFLTEELKRIQDLCGPALTNKPEPSNIYDEVSLTLARERFQLTEKIQAELAKIGL